MYYAFTSEFTFPDPFLYIDYSEAYELDKHIYFVFAIAIGEKWQALQLHVTRFWQLPKTVLCTVFAVTTVYK